MMDINCSEKCIHEKDGKCTLNCITTITNLSSPKSGCMYFSPKNQIKDKDLFP